MTDAVDRALRVQGPHQSQRTNPEPGGRAQREAARGRGGGLRLLAAPEVIRALTALPGLGDEAAIAGALGCRVALVAEEGRGREAAEVAAEARGPG